MLHCMHDPQEKEREGGGMGNVQWYNYKMNTQNTGMLW